MSTDPRASESRRATSAAASDATENETTESARGVLMRARTAGIAPATDSMVAMATHDVVLRAEMRVTIDPVERATRRRSEEARSR